MVAMVIGAIAIVGIVAMFLYSRRQEPMVQQARGYVPVQPAYVPIKATEKEGEFVRTYERRPKRGLVENYHLNDPNTWYKIEIPHNILVWSLRLRQEQNLHYTYEPSHATYMTLNAGETLSEDTSPNRGIRAIYVQCDTANSIAEFEVWTDGYY